MCVPWVVGLGFLCILEALCVLVLVYLEALCAFFWYIILLSKKISRNENALSNLVMVSASDLEQLVKLKFILLEF